MAEDFIPGELRVGPVTVRTKMQRKFTSAFRKEIARRYLKEAQQKSVDQGKNIMRQEIKASDKVASGILLNSVSSKYVTGRSATSEIFESEIFFREPGASYAGFANEGRGPGGVKIEKIKQWMNDRMIDMKYLFWITRKIYFDGTNKKGRGFVERAQKRIERNTRDNMRDAVLQIENEIRR